MASHVPDAAGVHFAADAVEDYYENWRPELVALVPDTARTVLDIGCGNGALGEAVKRRQPATVIGLELVPEAAEEAERRLDQVIRVNLDEVTELPLEPGTVDAALFGDVLEHLRDPHRLMRVIRRYLTDDAVIVCSVPNVKHWLVVGRLLVEDRFEYKQAGLLDHTHVHMFTLTELENMLEETGFEATHLETLDIEMPPEYRPMGEVVAWFGGDVAETIARLEAYQYIVAARVAR